MVLLGFLMSFLLPGRLALACSLVIAVAMGLEVMQSFIPDRDPASSTYCRRRQEAPSASCSPR